MFHLTETNDVVKWRNIFFTYSIFSVKRFLCYGHAFVDLFNDVDILNTNTTKQCW